ncbi:MAG: MATE family efflux transporter [Vibrio sp.]
MLDKHGLLSAPISVVLRKMAVPTSLGMLAILMFNLVDTFFISLLGTEPLAAVSFTFPITFALNCIGMGLGVGVSTHVGRLLGKGHHRQAALFTTHGLLLTFTLIAIASVTGRLTITPLFSLLGANTALLPLINQYMSIWYVTIPLLIIPMVGSSAIRSSGDTKAPAVIMIGSGIINGVLDPLLIFGYGPFPKLGIQGAAIASSIAWVFAFVGIMFVLICRKQLLCQPFYSHITRHWRCILKIGAPAGFSTAMMPLFGAIIMSILSQHGNAAVAAYGAAQRIESILILVTMSLTSALTPFMSQNFGAHNPQRSFAGLFLSMRFSLVFQLGLFALILPVTSALAALFSNDQHVQHYLSQYLLLVPLSYGFQGVVMMLVSALNALHQPNRALVWSVIRLFILCLPCAWLGSYFYGAEGLFAGTAIGNILGGIFGYLYTLKLKHHAVAHSDHETALGN